LQANILYIFIVFAVIFLWRVNFRGAELMLVVCLNSHQRSPGVDPRRATSMGGGLGMSGEVL
jgi:hypothetical protein